MTGANERADRQDITDLLIRYASGIDRRDWELFRTCWTPDCHTEYEGIGTYDGVDSITEFMIACHANMGHTLHRMTNTAIDLHGDTAQARTYVDVVLTTPDGRKGMRGIGFYDDDLVRTAGGWRMATRRYTSVFSETIGA